MENAFGILKHTFRELLLKSDLHLTFLPDIILTCAILHNILLGQPPDPVEKLLDVLRSEGMDNEDATFNALVAEVVNVATNDNANKASR